MKPYEQYKHSGIDWLGQVPSHWEIGIGMMILKENKRSNKGMKENTVLSLSYGEIIVKDESKLFGLVPESFETYQIVEPNDIIIRCTDLQNDKTSLRTGLAKNKGIITSAYLNLGVKQGYCAKFIYYYLHTLDITKVIYGLGSGLRQNLSFLDFRRLPFPLPPLPEQTAIAEFLDEKPTQIQMAIGIKNKQIAKLKEYRQALINQTVTKGLNANTPMKNSGVEWLGEVPSHWEVKKLKYVLQLSNEKTESQKSDLRYIGMENIVSNTGELTETILEAEGVANIFHQNEILFGKLRPYLAKVYLAQMDGICSTEFLVYKTSKQIFNKFAFYLMICPNFIETVNSSTYGTKMPRANSDFLANLSIPIPPLPEQLAIAEFLDEKTAQIDTAIAQYQCQIERLKEYQQSLVNDVVTGKMRVSNLENNIGVN